MTLSFIIPCYNSEKMIGRCLQSIIQQETTFKYEIIVVNDGSNDESLNIINKLKNNNISILSYSKNKGLAFARNYGAKHAKGTILAFVDSDMILDKQWAEKGLKYINNSFISGIMGQYHAPVDLKKNTLDRYLYSNIRGAQSTRSTSGAISFKYFLFSNTMIRKDIFKNSGAFDESFIAYGGEDTDLSIRIDMLYPNSLYYNPNMKSYHHGQKTLNKFCKNMHDFGKYNLQKIFNRYPDYHTDLKFKWISSYLSYCLFNFFIAKIINTILFCYPFKYLIRYKIFYSAIKGYRNRKILD